MNTQRTIIEVLNLLLFLGIISSVFFLGGMLFFGGTVIGKVIVISLLFLIIGLGVWQLTKKNEDEKRNVLGKLLRILPVINAIIVVVFMVRVFFS